MAKPSLAAKTSDRFPGEGLRPPGAPRQAMAPALGLGRVWVRCRGRVGLAKAVSCSVYEAKWRLDASPARASSPRQGA
jgi:hypothetical protein